MYSLGNKLIIYDSNCKVCSSMKKVVTWLCSIPEERVRALAELPPEHYVKVDLARFRNMMAVVDTAGGSTMYGAEGVAYIFSCKYRFLKWLLDIPLLFRLFAFLYNVQANNRYIMTTPKSTFTCECLPDRILRYRLSYIGIAFLVAIILTGLLALSFRQFFSYVPVGESIMWGVLIAGTGWLLQLVFAGVLLESAKFIDYAGHLGTIMVYGLLVQVPWIIVSRFSDLWIVPVVSLVASFSCMFYMHIGRVQYLQLSKMWSLCWLLFLISGAAFGMVLFYNFNPL
ncbi:DCC1-like thiol-disulfide oxidoreductase family protein [Cytophagaceae bacterium ABcell3]|nr:DCC1-like thiol-disulfide oxidoreductase family protein [Cytophagaceae bacterium ABcell3]